MALAVDSVAKDVPVTVIKPGIKFVSNWPVFYALKTHRDQPVPMYRGIEKKRSENGILKRVIWIALQIPEAMREEATISVKNNNS